MNRYFARTCRKNGSKLEARVLDAQDSIPLWKLRAVADNYMERCWFLKMHVVSKKQLAMRLYVYSRKTRNIKEEWALGC